MNLRVSFSVSLVCVVLAVIEAGSLLGKERRLFDSQAEDYAFGEREPGAEMQKRSVRCPRLRGPRKFIDSMFLVADRDQDGYLDDAEYDNLFDEFDNDHNSDVTLDEYVDRLVDVHHGQRSKAALLFRMGDFNQNQRLDLEDKRVVKQRLDENGDGLIHQCEFRKIWMQIADRAGIARM